jgi:hypothetical protein
MTKAHTIFFIVCITALVFTVFTSIGKKVASAAGQTNSSFTVGEH